MAQNEATFYKYLKQKLKSISIIKVDNFSNNKAQASKSQATGVKFFTPQVTSDSIEVLA